MTDLPTNGVVTGDCLDVLRDFPTSSVHMAMTSPPYWQLRDYGVDGQLGLEEDADDYVDAIADVCDEVKRVLRPDGSLWLNLGDTYDDKDLQQIPARVALELQDRGWILRNRVTWAKPNPMPQSVKDRLNDTTEAIFHLTPSKRYWYDLDAIRESYGEFSQRVQENPDWQRTGEEKRAEGNPGDHTLYDEGKSRAEAYHPTGKNPGDVFEVTTKPFPDAHFAVYPPELCEKPIKATCPPTVCAECGTPYERETRDESGFTDGVCNACGTSKSKHKQGTKNAESGSAMSDGIRVCSNKVTEGWETSCDCATDDTHAGIALDPFAGAGTTLLKAKELGRRFVGIELNPEYADMARARVGLSPHDPSNVRDDEAQVGLESY